MPYDVAGMGRLWQLSPARHALGTVVQGAPAHTVDRRLTRCGIAREAIGVRVAWLTLVFVLVADVAVAQPAELPAWADTSTPTWSPPPPPPPPDLGPQPSTTVPGSRFAVRLQGGLTSGVLHRSGGSLGLTGSLLTEAYRLEITGRYQLPRRVTFGESTVDLSIFEVGTRGCLSFSVGPVEVPLCAGVGGGRWSVSLLDATEASAADVWFGAHITGAATVSLNHWISLWMGVEAAVGLILPELTLVSASGAEVGPFQSRRFGGAIELGVEVVTF